MEQVVKNHTMKIISKRWLTKIYVCGNTWNDIILSFDKASGSTQIIGTFSDKH